MQKIFLQIEFYFRMIEIVYTEVPLYGICFFAGMGIAVSLSFLLARKKGIQLFDFLAAIACILIGALIGAKSLFLAVSWKEIMRLNLTFLDAVKGGFVFYGGLLGGLVALAIYCRQYKLDFYEYADIIAVPLPLGHALGRLGCLFGGCCYGIEYKGVGSIVYSSSYNIHTPLNVPLLPIQAIESLLLGTLFLVLVFYWNKNRKKGSCFFIYLLDYAIMRFVLEFFRGDRERGFLFYFSTAQWISLILIFSAILFALKYFRIKDKR